MSKGILKFYQQAGQIAAEARNFARKVVREGNPLIDICEKVEGFIKERGGNPAFPCNVCVNDVAAHYTSPPNDKRVVPRKSVVKVDIGVHVNGYIADTATTVCFNSEYDDMVHIAEEALEEAIQTIRHGVKASDVGAAVQKIVELRGFKPIWNLSGHQVGRYVIHTGKSIPNVSRLDGEQINSGEVYGVEPFITHPKAAGEVRGIDEAYIFRFQKERSLKNSSAKRLLKQIVSHFRTLPFSERWICKWLPPEEFEAAFLEILSSRSVTAYPVLVEVSGKVVAQAEHTVVVEEEGCVVLTI